MKRQFVQIKAKGNGKTLQRPVSHMWSQTAAHPKLEPADFQQAQPPPTLPPQSVTARGFLTQPNGNFVQPHVTAPDSGMQNFFPAHISPNDSGIGASPFVRPPAGITNPVQHAMPFSQLAPPPLPPPSRLPSTDTLGGAGRQARKRLPTWITIVLVLLVVLPTVIGAAAWWYYQSTYGSIVANSTGQTATNFTNEQDKGLATTNNASMGSERINILLLGSDTDAKFQGAYLAQTVIIVTIDPATKYIGMLSIPRDMQIAAPGYRASKLDEVFSFGFQSKKSNNPYADGAGLTIAALKANFGIPIHHYAWVGLDGFIKVIDTTGGVDVDVLHPMLDDVYPDDIDHTSGKAFTDYKQAHGYKRLYIAPGPQHLTGIQALEYVRTRHSDLVGDFGRSIRQQQVLNQLKARLATSDSIGKLPELAKSMDGYVKTSMELSDLINLANFARTIDTHTIERLVLSPPYSDSITNSSNFAPVCARIIPALEKMFGTGTCVPQVNNGSLSGLASTSSLTASVSTNTSAFSLQVSRQAAHVAQLSATSLSQAYGDIFGLRALLNLTFLVTFESLDSMIL